MNLVVELPGDRIDIAPGRVQSILVRSFTRTGKSWALNIEHDRDGRVNVICRCPAQKFSPETTCKHGLALEAILVADGACIERDGHLVAVAREVAA